MSDESIHVEVAFATPDNQVSVEVALQKGATVESAIEQSEISKKFAEIDLSVMAVGIYGKVCRLSKVVEQGDRVEIYRPLKQNPMEARRNRALSTR